MAAVVPGSAASPATAAIRPLAAVEPAWPGFRPLRVTRVVAESATVTSVYLAAADGAALPEPGRAVPHAAGGRRRRSAHRYAATRCPRRRTPTVPDQREARAARRGEPYLHAHLRPGGHRRRGTAGRVRARRRGPPVLLISAGIGVTPVLAMLHQLADGQSARACGGSTARAPAASTRSPPRRTSCCGAAARARTHLLHRGDVRGEPPASRRAGRPDAAQLAALGSAGRRDRVRVRAGRGSWPTCGTALDTIGRRRGRVHTELFGALPPINPGLTARARHGRRTSRRGRRAPGRWSRSPAAASRRRWTSRARSCSTWPTPATSRRDGAAAPASATPA